MKITYFFQYAALLLAYLCSAAVAQPLKFSDPGQLARVALGDEQGSVAVGVLQGDTRNFAYLKRDARQAAVATSADGSAQSAPVKAVPEQLFEIGSITKVFTGYLLALAVEKTIFLETLHARPRRTVQALQARVAEALGAGAARPVPRVFSAETQL